MSKSVRQGTAKADQPVIKNYTDADRAELARVYGKKTDEQWRIFLKNLNTRGQALGLDALKLLH